MIEVVREVGCRARWGRLMVIALLCAAVSACKDSNTVGDTSGSETHWLMACDEDAQCGAELSCECGVCTMSCEEQSDCDQPDAVCSTVGEVAFEQVCGRGSSLAGVCLAGCGSCGSADMCLGEACLPDSSTDASGEDASTGSGDDDADDDNGIPADDNMSRGDDVTSTDESNSGDDSDTDPRDGATNELVDDEQSSADEPTASNEAGPDSDVSADAGGDPMMSVPDSSVGQPPPDMSADSGGVASDPRDCPNAAGNYPPPPAGAQRCSDEIACPDGQQCVSAYSVGGNDDCALMQCNAALPECDGDGDCAAGEVCDIAPSDAKGCCPDALRCVAPCQQRGCGVQFICADDGHCSYESCADGYICPEGTRCAPESAGANAHDCELISCYDGYECRPGWTCREGDYLDSHDCDLLHCTEPGGECWPNTDCTDFDDQTLPSGCLLRSCSADADCDCGVCLQGSCEPTPGVCL